MRKKKFVDLQEKDHFVKYATLPVTPPHSNMYSYIGTNPYQLLRFLSPNPSLLYVLQNSRLFSPRRGGKTGCQSPVTMKSLLHRTKNKISRVGSSNCRILKLSLRFYTEKSVIAVYWYSEDLKVLNFFYGMFYVYTS